MTTTQATILHHMRWSHEETRRLLSSYAEGELRGLKRWRVSRHLARCEPCRSVYRSLLETLATLRRLGQPDLVDRPQLTADVLERAERKRNSHPSGF
jgi:predicted anti-sigma-YlaC factor YlaD